MIAICITPHLPSLLPAFLRDCRQAYDGLVGRTADATPTEDNRAVPPIPAVDTNASAHPAVVAAATAVTTAAEYIYCSTPTQQILFSNETGSAEKKEECRRKLE